MVTRRIPCGLWALVLFFAAMVSGGAQEYVELTAVADTLLQESIDAGTSSLARGTDETLEVGTRSGRHQRMLVRFDLSPIPSGADIISAELRLGRASRANFSLEQYADIDKNTYVFRLLRDWSETEASWNWSELNRTPWAGPGAVGPTDRAAAFTGDGNDTELRYPVWDVTSDAQLFVDGAAEHFGWMIVGPEDEIIGSNTLVVRFGTRETETDSDLPTLVVSYASVFNFDAWRAIHFTDPELADPTISGTGADPVGDGVPNLLKYAWGIAARQSARDVLPTGAHASDGLRLTYTRAKNLPDVEFVVESSLDLETWNSGPEHIEVVEVVDHGNSETITVRAVSIGAAAERAFLRGRVILQ